MVLLTESVWDVEYSPECHDHHHHHPHPHHYQCYWVSGFTSGIILHLRLPHQLSLTPASFRL